MEDRVTLTMKDQQRVQVVSAMERGEMSAGEGAEALGVSVRQVRRLSQGYRTQGLEALVHGNRGKRPHNAIDQAVKEQVVALGTTLYQGTNSTLLSELLTREDIHLSRSTVRRIMLTAGYRSPRSCRRRVRRQRRERRAQAGALVQIDGSPHDWLEGRGPVFSVLPAVDDATGMILGMVCRAQEDAAGYLELLGCVIETHGVPLAVYHDRHSIFQDNTVRLDTVSEQLAGTREPTQVGRAFAQLGIRSIAARSPQAKGRVERLNETLQERFRVHLRLVHAQTIPEAQAAVPSFIAAFNPRFSVPAATPEPVFRPAPVPEELMRILSFSYIRTVAADNTVRFAGTVLQLQPSQARASYARARVTVHEHLDGALSVVYQGQRVTTTLASPDAPTLRARGLPRAPVIEHSDTEQGLQAPSPRSPVRPRVSPPIPGPTHPWRTLSLRNNNT